MILPSGVNKMSGLCATLEELKFSSHNVVGVGDAENDHAFLESCECAVAVSNAIPSLKEKADLVTESARGAGVTELIQRLIENDLQDVRLRSREECIFLGKAGERKVALPAYGRNVLICGQSGSGKSTLVTGLIERIMEKKYQICLIDPEGDYEGLPNCRVVGDEKRPPSIEQVKQALESPTTHVVVNLVALTSADRPVYFASVVGEVQKLRLERGRPHWFIIDEAHHVLPSEWVPSGKGIAQEFYNLMLITVHPDHVSTVALEKVNTVIVVGREPKKILDEFANAANTKLPETDSMNLPRGEALLWEREGNRLTKIKAEPSRHEHYRHRRKYAEGQLEPDRVFHFRGPENKLDLRAQNLNIFVQIAEGIDEETWFFHLKQGDYSEWIGHCLKDEELGNQLREIETDESLSSNEARERIREAILQKYTAPE
jgi:energy-coupling factor transporter ATP-binding protein EcfA2